VIGAHHSVKIVKNKVAAPFKTTEIDIYYNEGISKTNDVLNIGTEQGIIEKAGSWYKYEGEKLGQGSDAASQHLKENPKIVEKIRKQLFNKLKEN
jgi:recombination protein RecA